MSLKGRSFTQKSLRDLVFQSWDGIYANHNATRSPSFACLRIQERGKTELVKSRNLLIGEEKRQGNTTAICHHETTPTKHLMRPKSAVFVDKTLQTSNNL